MTSNRLLPLVFALTVACSNSLHAQQENPSQSAGREIYVQHCASCHGANGEGQENWRQRNSSGELPAPPHNQYGHTWRHADDVLFRMIKNGWRDPFNKTDRLTMPAFGSILTDTEIYSLIMYLKSFWSKDQKIFQNNESMKNK